MPEWAKHISDWVGVLATAFAWAGACGGVVYGAWRFQRSVIRAARLSDAIHSRFGANPCDVLEKTLTEIRADASIATVIRDLLAHHLSLCVYVCDGSGKCEWANEPLCDLFGLDSAGMVGNGWLAAIDEQDRLETWEQWTRCVAAGVPYRSEYRIVNKRTGETIECETAAFAAMVDGKVTRYVGYVRRTPKEQGQ